MGEVFSAFDPQLDRKVAIKVLHRRQRKHEASERLRREAMAMARLAHPNVVSIHDVGIADERVFLAMEHIDGMTLEQWLASPRSLADILDKFRQAGRGLAAAHAADLVHRDFKPENAIVGNDGRVRVLDFGLARLQDRLDQSTDQSVEESPDLPIVDSTDESLLSRKLTRVGSVVGTPAYMAPEQMIGAHSDAQTDVFAFCLALFEAVYGERPFAGDTILQIYMNMQKFEIRELQPKFRVPPWLRRALLRGLAFHREQRWPSMEMLLAELSRDRTRRGRWLAGVAVSLVLGGGGWAFALAGEGAPDLCRAGPERVKEVYGEPQREAITEVFVGTKLAYGQDSARRVLARLDDYTNEWQAAYQQACEATHVRGEQSEALLDLRMTCLGEHLDALASTVDVLSQADRTVVEKAVATVLGLPRLVDCSDVQALKRRAQPPSDPKLASAVDEMRRMLDRSHALQLAGKYVDALDLANEVKSLAQRQAQLHLPSLARAHHLAAGAGVGRGAFAAAREDGSAAYWLNLGIENHEAACAAATHMIDIIGFRQAEPEAAQVWVERTKRVLPQDDALLVANFERSLGNVTFGRRELDLARDHYQNAIAGRESVYGADDLRLVGLRLNLASVMTLQQAFDEAQEQLESALAAAEAGFGEQHPRVAMIHNNIGVAYEKRGELDDAKRHHLKALELKLSSLGPSHPSVGASYGNLGEVAMLSQRYDEARDYHQKALDVFTPRLGERHRYVVRTRLNLAMAALAGGAVAVAKTHVGEVLDGTFEDSPAGRALHARAKFCLAKVLWETPSEQSRAVAWALEAQKMCEATDDRCREALRSPDAITKWLADHPVPASSRPK